ncbi:MAG: hypothetical protein IPO27_18970 [Bacteroidetes bacterium]|nr:hypothetical protein [Bacteroidota bacterium]
MEFPSIENSKIASYFNKVEIIQATANQIMKDFAMFGIDITYTGNVDTAYNELHEQLTRQIDKVIENSYSKLFSILYRIDVSEKELERAKIEMTNYNHSQIIAHQIIVRELKKVLVRMYYKP